ncbi:hypothetical protein [Cohnella boryungensis]
MNDIVPSATLIFEHIEHHKKLFKALDLIRKTPDLPERLEQVIISRLLD